jgi:hypothetical protein
VCYVVQECAKMDRSMLNCTGECYVGWVCVKSDWSVLNWTGGIAKLDSIVLSWTVVW